MKQPIELRRLRDFGQIINDTFTFLKENFKQLFIFVLIICGFFIILGTISTVFTLNNAGHSYTSDNYEERSRALIYLISVLTNLFILILAHLCIFLVTLCYVSLYIQKNNSAATLPEVWGYFRYYFFRAFGSGLVITILSALGFLFCLIPGIYLMPIFYLIIPIIVIENASFRYAFNKSFRLIKDNWWVVFGVIFIMGIIGLMSGLFVNISLEFVQAGGKLFPLKRFAFPLTIFFSALKNILMLVNILPAIAISLCYFSLSEEKDGTGLLDRINQMGKNDNDHQVLPAEEY
ncbi:hypothetical protein [Mucilaginibacter sp.]|uniref:hypothetical protein n=1 Tax=Mucilaginibacter sp. TaxID=1882438 RepID=UPI0026048652|nr:hypothetical protein [Mucilaginibacter sp.]MDB4922373.1 hypothetical protein [Mucilaginibacter sp.]